MEATISHGTMESEMTYENCERRMLSRAQEGSISILHSLEPGQHSSGCFVCCASPACLPMCSIFPCCDDSDYVRVRREASKYIYIRENSLEWNEPRVAMKTGSCLGIDPCRYEIQDQVTVIYFDDPMFDRMTDQTRMCNQCRTCFCGGRGERIRFDSPFCCNLLIRGSFPCCCIPICCPTSNVICPCILRYEVHLSDAQKGLYEIKKAKETATNLLLLDSARGKRATTHIKNSRI